MYKHSTVVNNTLYVDGIDRLDLARSCACGQSFRWHEDNGGFTAPALGRVVHARQAGDTLSIYPCAEGAGYAGGIMSAAVDGMRVAMALMGRYAPADR